MNSLGDSLSCMDRLVHNQKACLLSGSLSECLSLPRGEAFSGADCDPVRVSKLGTEIGGQEGRQERTCCAQSACDVEQRLHGLYPRAGPGQELANLGKIISVPGKIVVNSVRDGAREQENIRGHLRLLPTLLHPIELVEFFR